MKSQHKNKTAAIPHRIMSKTSIYLAKQCRVDKDDFLGYKADISLENSQKITVRSSAVLTPRHGKIFEYVLSQWQATKKNNENLKEINIDIEEIVRAIGLSNRTENRKMIVSKLKQLMNVTISYQYEKINIVFHLLENITIVDGTKTIAIQVSETYKKAINEAKERYINVSDVMPINDKYAIELMRLLQLKGSGLDAHRTPKLVKSISHQDICKFMHLDDTDKKNKDIIYRAFNNIRKRMSDIHYSYNSRTRVWTRKAV